jgi:hypothetical protein
LRINWIITAVGKHVIAEDALAGGNEGIGVDEAADGGIVITALQIIEAGILGGGLAKRQFCLAPGFQNRKPGAHCVVAIGESLLASWAGS